MKKRKKKYFQRVDYIFRHNALLKFATKKAWYNFNVPFGYKSLYFLAFYCLFVTLSTDFSKPTFYLFSHFDNYHPSNFLGPTNFFSAFIGAGLVICWFAGIPSALILIFALVKALTEKKLGII